MPRFLIEVPHEASVAECTRTVEVFLRTGSHFLTHADWGCHDGDHRSWITIEVGSKDEARAVIPAAFRAQAKIVQLNTFTMDVIEAVRRDHQL